MNVSHIKPSRLINFFPVVTLTTYPLLLFGYTTFGWVVVVLIILFAFCGVYVRRSDRNISCAYIAHEMFVNLASY